MAAAWHGLPDSEPESERARVFPATSSGQIRSSPPAWPPAPLGLAAPLRPQGGVIMTIPLQPRGWGWEGSFPKKGGVRPQTHRNSGLLASLPKLCVFSTLRPRTRSGEGGHRTAPRMALIASSGGRQILCFGFLTVTFLSGYQVPQSGTLQLSRLREGTYTLQLTVVDTAGQRSSDNISVTVLPVAFSTAGEKKALPTRSQWPAEARLWMEGWC